jgi:acetyl esterase/lipase
VELVRVLCGPDLRVDAEGFRRLCETAAAEIGASAEVLVCDEAESLSREITETVRARSGALVCAGSLGSSHRVQQAVLSISSPSLVWLDLRIATTKREAWLDPARVASLRGRGLEGVRWAMRWLAARAAWAPIPERYGAGPEQTGDLRVPEGPGPHPIVVLLHGGGWRERWERDLMDGLAVDLAQRGYASWNPEFRRVGPSSERYDDIFDDVSAAVDHVVELAERFPLDLDRVIVSGHSAGGHLAVWIGCRDHLPTPSSSTRVRPMLLLSLAGVHDLVECASRGTDEMSTLALVGGAPDEVPDRYATASPKELLPIDIPQLLIHGLDDRPDLVDLNRTYAAAAAAAGCEVHLVEIPGADHFDVIDPTSPAWGAIVDQLEQTLARLTGHASSVEPDAVGGTSRARPPR